MSSIVSVLFGVNTLLLFLYLVGFCNAKLNYNDYRDDQAVLIQCCPNSCSVGENSFPVACTPQSYTIQVTSFLRDYITGPIDESSTLSFYDSIIVTAGKISQEKSPGVNLESDRRRYRQWAMYGEFAKDKICHLEFIYNYGEQAVFRCPGKGTYQVFASDIVLKKTLIKSNHLLEEGETTKTIFQGPITELFKLVYNDLPFEETEEAPPWNVHTPDIRGYERVMKRLKNGNGLALSDPIFVEKTDYCYYWDYTIVEKSRVGYVYNEVEPSSTQDGTYIEYDIYVWIMEPSSKSDNDRSHSSLTISDYSKLLTRRFASKGLNPCIRKAHGALEVVNKVRFYSEVSQNVDGIDWPHWKITIKVHTDTIISTLTDIVFTIAARQHVALYNCFTGNVRGFFNTRSFKFLQLSKHDRAVHLNYEASFIPLSWKAYIKTFIRYIYGHGTAYRGQYWNSGYQPGSTRTDMTIFSNACMAQEFGIAVGGRLYVANSLVQHQMNDVTQVNLPGLLNEGSEEIFFQGSQRHADFFEVLDAAFTPTHLVLLMADGTVVLHPNSLSRRGMGKLIGTQKYGLGSLVRRRWCAKTGTPLNHNMLIPAFGDAGNIILIQIYPVEGPVKMWGTGSTEDCKGEGTGFVGDSEGNEVKSRNETKIHIRELVVRSDEKGIDIPLPLDAIAAMEEEPEPEPDIDSLQTFLLNFGKFLRKPDPHFSSEFVDPATKKIGKDNMNFNNAAIFQLERVGRTMHTILQENGVSLDYHGGNEDFPHSSSIQDVQFTAVEKKFIIAAKFDAKELQHERKLTIMVATLTAIDFSITITYDIKDEKILETEQEFSGWFLARSNAYYAPTTGSLDEDDVKLAGFLESLQPPKTFTTVIHSLNSALPQFVVALGDIYVFTSFDGRFARPISFYTRRSIINPSSETSQLEETPMFDNGGGKIHDILVTEKGIMSILFRKPYFERDIVAHDGKPINSTGQSVVIGSVATIEPLREIQPFIKTDRIFQVATPDGEIVYGKFRVRESSIVQECNLPLSYEYQDFPCILQPPEELSHLKYCSKSTDIDDECQPWKITSTEVHRHFNDFDWLRKKIPRVFAKNINKTKGPLYIELDLPTCLTNPGLVDQLQPPNCKYKLPKNVPKQELDHIELLPIPFFNLLYGNYRLTESKERENNTGREDRDKVCPFAAFEIIKENFNFAEVGFVFRITATVAYLSPIIIAEADIIVEYDDLMGVSVEINTKEQSRYDKTTITKTMDILFTLTDYKLQQMKSSERSVELNESMKGREPSEIFSITIRPSILNLYCHTDLLFNTIQINLGCNPFSEMRLMAEATTLERFDIEDKKWTREGNFLVIPSEDIHVDQRIMFHCPGANSMCKIPFANLYEDNIFEISYQNEFTPKFEQFLTTHARRVIGNIIIYDLLGSDVDVNVTRLEARCYNNGNGWYKKLQKSVAYIGKNISEYEDIYNYYEDCFSHDRPIEKPSVLTSNNLHLHNVSNYNSITFNRTRNKIFILRAAVVNTDYNRFTYCKEMSTFFLIQVAGIPTPRTALLWNYYVFVAIFAFLVLLITYIVFSFAYEWKGEVGSDELMQETLSDNAISEEEEEDTGTHGDHLLQRFALRLHALAHWKRYKSDRAEDYAEPMSEFIGSNSTKPQVETLGERGVSNQRAEH